MHTQRKTSITANRYHDGSKAPKRDKKNGYRTKTRSQITEVHRARSENGLGCKNCIYANFCATQPNLREYLYGIAKQDMKELTANKYWRLF